MSGIAQVVKSINKLQRNLIFGHCLLSWLFRLSDLATIDTGGTSWTLWLSFQPRVLTWLHTSLILTTDPPFMIWWLFLTIMEEWEEDIVS